MVSRFQTVSLNPRMNWLKPIRFEPVQDLRVKNRGLLELIQLSELEGLFAPLSFHSLYWRREKIEEKKKTINLSK